MSAIIPFKELELILAEGENVVFNGPEILKPFISNVQDYLHYYAYLNNAIGHPFLFIKDTSEVVGTFFECEKGKVILIPGIKQFNIYTEKEKNDEINYQFIEGIKLLDKAIRFSTEEYHMPEWVANYLLPDEVEKNNLLNKKIQELKILESNVQDIKQDINYINKNKILICGKDKFLEDQVSKVLEEIGFTIIDWPEGRDDIIVSYNALSAVIEVKGVKKSAAEKHAAQLEKWVSNYYETNEKPAKGILIVNAFCDTPLEDRTEEAFPKQMLPYSTVGDI